MPSRTRSSSTGSAGPFRSPASSPSSPCWRTCMSPPSGRGSARRRAAGLQRPGESAGDLSYGQQKLLEFAFIAMARPSVILLDEPAGGVNPSLLRHISERIRALNSEGVTFIIVEHDMEFVMRLCDRVLVMHQGSALTSGPPEQVRADPAVLEAYLGTGPKEGS